MTRAVLAALCVLCLYRADAANLDGEAPTVFITGSNRGLGLEFARQYAGQGWNVIATCRNPADATELQDLARDNERVVIYQLDVTRDEQVSQVASAVGDQPIDVLLNNAGIYGNLQGQTWGTLDFEEGLKVFDVNSLGGLRVSQALMDNVLASQQKKIISLGGGMGTQTIGSMFGGHYFMKMSKAAHLIAMGTLQTEFKKQGVLITMISPGRVDTQLMRDSGWTGKSIPAEVSAAGVIERIALLDEATAGRLINMEGQATPW